MKDQNADCRNFTASLLLPHLIFSISKSSTSALLLYTADKSQRSGACPRGVTRGCGSQMAAQQLLFFKDRPKCFIYSYLYSDCFFFFLMLGFTMLTILPPYFIQVFSLGALVAGDTMRTRGSYV